jgi:hypothetical protein
VRISAISFAGYAQVSQLRIVRDTFSSTGIDDSDMPIFDVGYQHALETPYSHEDLYLLLLATFRTLNVSVANT